MKKLASVLLALCLVFGTCAFAAAEDTVYNVAILQFVQHEALDAATQGFKDVLSEKLGDKVKFAYDLNASGDIGNCSTEATTIVSDPSVNLIMGNATPALQACFNATADIPVLGTSITHYGSALELEMNEDGSTGKNVSGTSDLAPLDGQAAMIKELFPEAKTVGLLYCSSEANSVFQIIEISKYLEELGFEIRRFAFNDSNELPAVVQAATECNVIYIPTDNTAAANTEAIANVVLPAGVPVVTGEEGICKGCGVATLTISYYDLGVRTGEMAYDILVNGADVSAMPVAYAPQFTRKYNAANAAELGVTIPEGYEAIAE